MFFMLIDFDKKLQVYFVHFRSIDQDVELGLNEKHARDAVTSREGMDDTTELDFQNEVRYNPFFPIIALKPIRPARRHRKITV